MLSGAVRNIFKRDAMVNVLEVLASPGDARDEALCTYVVRVLRLKPECSRPLPTGALFLRVSLKLSGCGRVHSCLLSSLSWLLLHPWTWCHPLGRANASSSTLSAASVTAALMRSTARCEPVCSG